MKQRAKRMLTTTEVEPPGGENPNFRTRLQDRSRCKTAAVKRGLFGAALIHTSYCIAFSQSIDKSKPYVRVCVAVMDSGSGEEKAFEASSAPGAGKKIVAHVDANSKCELVVAAFNRKDGQLAYNWTPQFLQVAEWNEVALPKAP